jgi:hypothetical protein
VAECKNLLRQSTKIVDMLTALTGASNRVRAFPELAAGEETALGLLNRISHARLTLARALDSEESSSLGGEMAQVHFRRKELMAAIEGLPLNKADFGKREQQGVTQWNTLSQELTRRLMEIDQLQATINGLRRMMGDGPQAGVARDPASVGRLNAELDTNERDLKRFRDEVGEIRRQLDMGRAQIGLGDARYQRDASARDEFRDVLEREVQLASGGGAGGDAARFAGRASGVLGTAREYEGEVEAALRQIEAQVAQRAQQLQARIDAERASVFKYQQQLGALSDEAKDLVGHVAQRNLGFVRDELRKMVLRADVGITEQAWEVREEELDRVRSLQSERARQEQILDEELKEVRDDGVETGHSK